MRQHNRMPPGGTWIVRARVDGLQYFFPGGNMDEQRMNEKLEPLRELFGSLMEGAPRIDARKMVVALETYYSSVAKEVDGPCSLEGLRKVEAAEKNRFNQVGLTGMIWNSLLPFGRAYRASLRQEASRRGTILVFALHDHKEKNRNWPKSLDELKLKKIEELRIDPYSGKDFVYRLEDGKPLLYSVGLDGDSGGKHNAEFDEEGVGTDYVYWPYRE